MQLHYLVTFFVTLPGRLGDVEIADIPSGTQPHYTHPLGDRLCLVIKGLIRQVETSLPYSNTHA